MANRRLRLRTGSVRSARSTGRISVRRRENCSPTTWTIHRIGATGRRAGRAARPASPRSAAEYAFSLRETRTQDIIEDVHTLRSESGWIGHSAIPLIEQAQRYLAELRAIVSGFGVALPG
jgi:hypothetical protein